jgi:hypothetical protein
MPRDVPDYDNDNEKLTHDKLLSISHQVRFYFFQSTTCIRLATPLDGRLYLYQIN